MIMFRTGTRNRVILESDGNLDLELALQRLSQYVRKNSELKLCLKFITSI